MAHRLLELGVRRLRGHVSARTFLGRCAIGGCTTCCEVSSRSSSGPRRVGIRHRGPSPPQLLERTGADSASHLATGDLPIARPRNRRQFSSLKWVWAGQRQPAPQAEERTASRQDLCWAMSGPHRADLKTSPEDRRAVSQPPTLVRPPPPSRLVLRLAVDIFRDGVACVVS